MKISMTPISVSRMMRENGWTVERFVGYCAEQGADGVDILHARSYPWFWKDPARDMAALPGWIDKAGLKLAAFAAGNNFAKLREEDLLGQVALVKEALQAAADLGAPVLRIFGGHHEDCGGEKGVRTHNGLGLVMRGIELCLKEAEARGVVMALENHGRLPGHAYEIAAVIRAFNSPFVKCTFDCANFMGNNMDEPEDPLRAYDHVRGHVAHVHVKDTGPSILKDRQLHGYVAGKGVVPLRQLLAALEADGYAGYCSLEYEAGMIVPEEYGVPQSMDYLKDIRAIHQTLKQARRGGTP
jgi:sugar phosphate isomerase/epimerase